jgi:hypothetical protein
MNKLILTTTILSIIANFDVYSQCYNGTNTNPISSSPDSASIKSNPKNKTFLKSGTNFLFLFWDRECYFSIEISSR